MGKQSRPPRDGIFQLSRPGPLIATPCRRSSKAGGPNNAMSILSLDRFCAPPRSGGEGPPPITPAASFRHPAGKVKPRPWARIGNWPSTACAPNGIPTVDAVFGTGSRQRLSHPVCWQPDPIGVGHGLSDVRRWPDIDGAAETDHWPTAFGNRAAAIQRHAGSGWPRGHHGA